MSNQVIFYIMGGSVAVLVIIILAYYILSKKMQKSEYRQIKKLQQAGKALLIAPSSDCGVDTFTKNKKAFLNLYQKGYDDGSKIAAFLA